MFFLPLLNFIRFRILYISTKYIWIERKFLGKDTYTPFGNLIGMVSNEIRNYCYDYGKYTYTGKGALIDLGSWLGSSVIPLVAGLRKNPSIEYPVVHAFDHFIWYENMDISIQYTSLKNKHKVGDDFLSTFQKQTAQYSNHILVHKGNLNHVQWNKEPIEYIMIDAMKDWETAKQIVYTFYPHLIPNESIIIHEDFCHHYTSWIHLIQYRLKAFFEPLDEIKNSSGIVFRCIQPITNIKHLIPEDFQSFTAHEIEMAFDYSLSLVSKNNKNAIIASKIMAYRHLGNYKKAKEALKQVPLFTLYTNTEMREVKKILT